MILITDTLENIIGFVSDGEDSLSLTLLRNKIKLEHSLGQFKFVIFETEVNSKQESTYQLKHIATESVKEGFSRQIVLKIHQLDQKCYQETNLTVQSVQKDTIGTINTCVSPCEKSTQCSSTPSETPTGKTKNNIPKTLSFQSNQRKKQVPYSIESIESACGFLEKEMMVYYNRRIKEFEEDYRMDDWGVQQRDGVIDVAWTKNKFFLLQIEVTKILSKLDKIKNNEIEGVSTEQLNKLESFENKLLIGIDKTNEEKFNIEKSYKTFCEGIQKKVRSRKVLEESFDVSFSNVKEAQANLVKNIRAITDCLSSMNVNNNESSSVSEDGIEVRESLTTDEINELTQEVHKEDDEIFE